MKFSKMITKDSDLLSWAGEYLNCGPVCLQEEIYEYLGPEVEKELRDKADDIFKNRVDQFHPLDNLDAIAEGILDDVLRLYVLENFVIPSYRRRLECTQS